MTSAIVTLIINSVVFYLISKILPGFRIKNDGTALAISASYSVLMAILSFFMLPIAALIGVILAFLAIIPIIGPLLAASGLLVSTFITVFGVSAILLIIIDKIMQDFEMDSVITAFIASFLLAILNVGIRFILPGI
jgi:uncharacterized membrane protein YvlD (DUF360 family)